MPAGPRTYFNRGHGYVDLCFFLAVGPLLLEIKIWFVAFLVVFFCCCY